MLIIKGRIPLASDTTATTAGFQLLAGLRAFWQGSVPEFAVFASNQQLRTLRPGISQRSLPRRSVRLSTIPMLELANELWAKVHQFQPNRS